LPNLLRGISAAGLALLSTLASGVAPAIPGTMAAVAEMAAVCKKFLLEKLFFILK
jgi:hypothetical protein